MRPVLYAFMAVMVLVAMAAPPLIPLAVGYCWILTGFNRQQRDRQRREAARVALRQRQARRQRILAFRSLP